MGVVSVKKRERRAVPIWSLDTEDDSKGNVFLINFFDGSTHSTFRDRSEAIDFLSRETSQVQIWCTNLGYDLVNLFGEWISLLEITYIQSRVISAKIAGTQIHFRDTLNHWKISVREMGERIGLKKLDVNGDFDNVEYCQRDSEITWRFVMTMKEKYDEIGCRLKATIGATALDFYYSKFGKREPQHFKPKDTEFMLKGYFGGRTEIFFNRVCEGRIQYFDFNSLYPAVMSENTFPVLKGAKRTRNPQIDKYEGIAHATVRSPADMHVPYLPFRSPDNGSLVFPLGTFKGHWTYFELREAKKLGYEILRFHTAIEFRQGSFRPFESYVGELYSKRLKAKQDKDELLSDSYKLLMNNLYGKFAQGNEVLKLMPFERSKLKHGDTIFGNQILRKVKGDYPEHTNVIWSAYVTAFGRHKLFEAMKKVCDEGGLLLYCDTDSIIFESERDIFRDEAKLGGLKSEGEFELAYFKLPKLYKLVRCSDQKSLYRAKGVPRSEAGDFFEKGKAKFKRPYKLKETLRRNLSSKRKVKLIPNFWDTTEKELKKSYDKRQVETTGHTRPLEFAIKRGKTKNQHPRKTV